MMVCVQSVKKHLLSNAALDGMETNSWVNSCETRKWLLETLDGNTGVALRFADWAPTKHTHMVQNRIPDCPVVVCCQAPLA
jgi:hypothetical protein